MSSHEVSRTVGRVLLTLSLVCASVLGGAVLQSSAAAAFAARASVTPGIQYVGDSAGTTFTFTVKNTGTTDTIGAVEISRPGKSWTIKACPSAPAGWSAQRSDTKCRYRSGASTSDDIAPGHSSAAFKVTASSAVAAANVTGTWPVSVSRSSTFDKNSKLVAAAATPPGLGITAYSFEVLDVVVDPATTTPGAACPASDKSASAATGDHTFVVCGRNRTTGTLTPTAAQSSLAGTFVAGHGAFASGPVAPTGSSRILGSWDDVAISSSVGTNKTVVAKIGSASNRTSPVTTLDDYEATASSNTAPVAVSDEKTVAEDSTGATVDVLANDSDADGDTLAVSGVDTTGTAGSVTNNGTDVTYDPNGAFDSLGAGDTDTDTFSYTVSDGNGGTDTATVTITITGVGGVNAPPVASDDVKTVGEDSSGATVDVLANDTDADGDSLAVSAVDTTGTAGQVTNNGTDVTYDPNGAFDALNAGDTDTDSFTYTVSDGNGGTDTATVTITITGVGGVNVPPVASDDVKTVGEDSSGATVDVLANDTDADGDTLTVSAVDTTGTTGLVTNNGTDVTYDPNGSFENLLSGATATDSFSYTVSDGNGGTDTATVTVTITGVNDAPVVTGLEAGALAYTENAAATVITASGTVTDVDSANFSTGTLTVDYSAGGQAEDRLEIRHQGTGAGQIGVSGSDVTFAGTTIGTFTGGAGTTALVVTLDPDATPAATQALVRNITYRNVSENPSTTARTARFVLTDGDGGTSAPATRQIAITPTNDAPVASDDVKSVAEDSTGATVDVLANDTDADADTLAVSAVDTTGTAGVVTNNGTDVTYDPNGAFDALGAGDTATDTFTYTVSDGHGGTDTATVTITVTGADAANAAPVATDDVKTVGEDSTGATVDVLANDTDADADTLAVSAVDTTGTTGLVTNNGADVTYDPNGAFESLLSGDTATDTFSYTVSDGNGGTDTATVTVTITGVNDAPVVTGLEGGALAYTENAAATPITATGTVTDVDSANFSTGTLTVDYSAGGQAEDRLEIRDQGTGAGQVGVSGANVTYGGTTIGTFAGGTGTAPLVVTLNASATPTAVQALVRNITYRNASESPSTTTRTARFVLTDGDGGTSSPATRQITVAAVNDAPVVTIDLLSPTTYAEQAGFQNLFGPATTLSDDSATLSSVTVTVSTGFDAAFDTVRLNPLITGFTTSFTGGVLTITRAGGTPAQFENALRNIQFSNTSDDPDHRNDGTANPTDANRVVSVTADDGASGGISAVKTQAFSITAVNDAPGAPSVLPTTTGIRNTTLAAGSTPTEPHVTRAVNFEGSATDPDGLESAITVTPVTSAATAQGGRITLAANGDLRYEPPASASLASDTYGYSLSDGTSQSAPITFTVNLSGAVWYVADGASGTQDGTAARPFGTIAGALAVAGTNQAIHLRRAPGDGILSAGVTLQTGQKLIGEGVALTNADVGSATAETLYPAGTKPVLTASNADVITLASNAQVAGVTINPDGSGGGLFGNATAGVTLRSMDVNDTGTAATQPGIEMTGAGNALALSGAVSLSTTQAGALNLNGTALSGTLAFTTVTGSTTSPGVSLTNTTGSLTFTTTAITTTNQPGFVLSNATNIDVAAGGVAATNRAAVDATGLAAGSDLTFTDVDSTNSTGDGVNLDGTDTAWTFSAGSGSTITGAAGIGFDVNNGSGTVSYAGTVGASGAGKAIDVSSRTTGSTFSGNITGAGTGGGISVTDNSAGTVAFSGATKTMSTGAGAGVSLTNNVGSTIAFTNGGLAITSTSGAGFNATGGGTVTVTGTGNTISTTTGTGLNINGTAIGAANVTFQSIASNGAASGIVLTNTGSAGTFNVTGTAAADSGGTIQNTTGPGISLSNADAISLNRMKLQGTDRSGIQGTGVTGFSLTNSTITNAGDTHANDNDSSIAFNDTGSPTANNVDGAVTITGNTLTNAFGAGIEIFQYAGTISNAVITGNTISSSFDPAQSRRSGIALNLFGSTTTVASLTKGNISNNSVTGFPSGDGISLQGANTASSTAPAGTYGTPGSATNIVTFTGNQVIGDTTNRINGFGIAASVTGRGQGNFSITNNGTVASPLRNMKSSAVAIGAAGDVTAYFVVTGNQIDAHNGFGSSTLALGTDKNIQADSSTLSNPVVRATITGNSIAHSDGTGIRVLHRSSNGSLNLRLENNAVPGPFGAGSSGISVENGSSNNVLYNPTMCASISNNSTGNGSPDGFGDTNPGITLNKANTSASTYVFGLTGLAPSPATTTQTEAFVTGLNPASALGAGSYAGERVHATGDNYTSCTLPVGM